MKILLFFVMIAVIGIIFLRPIKQHFADLFPDQASREEKQFVGTVSGQNPRVQEIQQMLKDLKFYSRSLDGKMGPQTRKALEAFQRKNNISVTGKADSKTLTELRKQIAARAKDIRPIVKKKDVAAQKVSYNIKTIQSLLKNAGFYKGEIDGKMGPETVRAIKQFQRSKNLKESGVINVKTWEELKKYESGR